MSISITVTGSPWLKEIGRFVRARRVAEGYSSQQQLAVAANIHTHTIHRLETGESVGLDVLEVVALALRIDPRELAGCGIPSHPSGLGDEEAKVLEAYRLASRKDRLTAQAALGLLSTSAAVTAGVQGAGAAPVRKNTTTTDARTGRVPKLPAPSRGILQYIEGRKRQ